MSLRISKIGSAFTAEGTVAGRHYMTDLPMDPRMLVDWLKTCGFHQTDIGDAMYEADPHWLERLDQFE